LSQTEVTKPLVALRKKAKERENIEGKLLKKDIISEFTDYSSRVRME
jgi:hypothetical protein